MSSCYDVFKPSEMYIEYMEEFDEIYKNTIKCENFSDKKTKKNTDKMKLCVIKILITKNS